MKVVTHAEFLTLPAGTVFVKFQPNLMDTLCIKHETLEQSNDFTYESLDGVTSAELDAFKQGKEVYGNFGSAQRDGCFDDEQLYIVWWRWDVQALIDRLQLALEE